MKIKPALLACSTTVILIMTGCTTYPKNYTYSPTVTISGNDSSSSPVILPNPFSKTPRSRTDYNINYNAKEDRNCYPAYNYDQTYVFVGPEYLQPQ